MRYEALSEAEPIKSRITPAASLKPEESPESNEPAATAEEEFEPEESDELEPSSPDSGAGTGRWLAGSRGILVGLGLGVAIAVVGMRFMASQNSTPTAKTPVAAQVNNAQPAAGQTVTVAAAQTASVARTLDATGTVAAYDLLPVLPKTTGVRIEQVLVDEGDFVEAGQVMAILDDSVLKTQISQAQAEVESSQATAEERQAGISQAEAGIAQAQANRAEAEAGLAQARANLAEARARLAQAGRERDRYEQLAESGAISRQDAETRSTEAITAQEAVRVAEANIRSAEAKISSAQANVESAQAKVSSAKATASSAQADVRSSQAGVEKQQTQIEQTLVKAPASGIVAERIARVGDVANGTQKLFSIIRGSQLELQAKVPETQLAQVKIGTPVRVTSDADSRIQLEGTVREIAPLVDAESRQATLKIDLPASDLLRPGMFLRAAITASTTQGLTVPAKAILPQADGRKIVYILEGENKVKAQPVEVGEIAGGAGSDLTSARVEIKSGLKPGDRVVVAGAGYLKDGDTVKVVPEESVKSTSQL